MERDFFHMKRALLLAERGRRGTSPNPMVGCVVARGRRVLAEGWHSRFGGAHAEASVLAKAGNKARGATVYITLEPCCHWGKTPPCTDALIKSRIKRVVACHKDPNPLVNGRGFARLKAAGIQVHIGFLEEESRWLNRAYLIAHAQKIPYLIYKFAQTLDGKIASRTGRSHWISNPQSRRFGHGLRAECDAILVGAETVRRDNPGLTAHGLGPDPLRLVLTSSLQLTPSFAVFNGQAPTWLLTSAQASAERGNVFRKKGVQILKYFMKDSVLDLKAIFKDLWKNNVRKILLEGGGNLAGSLMALGLINEVYAFVSPRFLGGRSAPTSLEGLGWASPGEGPALRRVDISTFGRDILIHGILR